uniref:Myosin XVI n=1 Tax=Oryzias sinensis TaxID=183150 RepID=A0A8C7YQ64_9TELE
ADFNTSISSEGSLLHLCARHDNVFAAELLIERGLNVNRQDEDLWTALHVACACDHADAVLLLLMAGANILLQDVNGNIPLDYAFEGTETRYILQKYLEENGVDVTSLHTMKTQRPNNMLADVKQLVASGGSLNLPNEDGVTLLHIACASGYREVVSVLLKNGADPHPADCNFWTPLHLAARFGQVKFVIAHRFTDSLCPVLDVAVSEHIATILLDAEESWLQRLKDPSTPVPRTDHSYDGGSYDIDTPLKSLNPLGVSISKRDSFLEKFTMFREAGGALSRHPSQDNGLDGPLNSGPSKLEQVKLMPPAPNDDLASLSELTDSSLLYEMQKRFSNDQIYTYIGHILLLINPNKELPIYSTLVSQLYLSSTGRLCSSLPPHIFSSAERAFHMMLQERRPQCFILSGESGSGKSEACKHIVRHLTARSCSKGFVLEPRMKHVNCILEAFGHAKTPRNDNSSRFIKLLTVQYCEKRETMLSAHVCTYMLEKSRLVHLLPQQHNFRIFYLMAEGLSPEEKSVLYTNNVLAHRYATASAQSREHLAAVRQSLRALGFNKQEVESVFMLLSAVLHIGDLSFTALTDANTAFPSDLQLLERVAALLQVSSGDLGAALTSDVQYIKGNLMTRHHTVEMSELYRDLLAKAIYGRLFSYLVNCINEYLQGQDDSPGNPSMEIGILDILGFEEFQKNGFEQLCVNMTNERLRQHVSEVLFRQEQAECIQEGISMEMPCSPSNHPGVVDYFLQKPQGLLCVLDEESQSLRPAEQTLFKRLSAQLDATPLHGLSITTKDGNGNPPPKNQGPAFIVSHYAAQVSYDLTGSLAKNKDSLPQNLLFTMKSSESVLLQQLFQSKLTQTGSLVLSAPGRLGLRGSKAALLLHKMPTTALVNILKKKGSSSFVQRLERCGPVTAAVQLRVLHDDHKLPIYDIAASSPNFPKVSTFILCTCNSFFLFLDLLRYKDLAVPTLGDKKKLSAEDRCRCVLQQSKLQGWQIGTSKVFLRYWQADQLNDRCYQFHKKIITCQKVIRGWLARQLVRRKLSLHHKEDCSVQRFLQGAEDMGLQTYDQLVIQNAADIARESDRLRSQAAPQHKTSGKVNEGPANTGCRLIRHFRSSSGPTPLAMDNMVHFSASPPIKPALQQVVTQSSDDGAGSINLSSPRKQPPPKPKRDPNTRLSASYEAVSAGLTLAAKESSTPEGYPRPHSDDYTTMRKVPPPKPKRSPNTKLTGSYEEINAVASQLHQLRPADVKLALLSRGGGFGGLMQRAASLDAPQGVALSLYKNHDEEDIYIEMMGSQPRARSLQEPPDSPDMADSEAVYEEMKYLPALTLGLGNCEIPAPFPNLLPHRPPLLVFPPSPVTCSPASDESPLTPLEVKKLPVFETSLNYATGPDSPLSPQFIRQRADSSPSLTVLMPEKKSTPPLTPPPQPPPPSAPPPPYRPPSHFPFPPEASFLAQNRAASIPSCSDSPKTSSQRPCGEPLGKPPPYSPVKASRPEPRRAHSCSSSPLLFNPANGRPLTSPLDELNTLFSSGRSLLRKSTSGRKSREGGLFEECGSAPTSPSLLQDKNANNHSLHSPSPITIENGNQISNGNNPPLHNLLQVFQRLRLSNGDESAALRELLNWRRAQCEGRTDWRRRASQSPPLPPTLLWTNRKASP